MRAVKYGVTKHYVLGLEVVLPKGDVITLGSKCIKDVAGYSMTELFIGPEGTQGIIAKAIVKLLPRPETVHTLATCFKDIQSAGRAVTLFSQAGVTPSTLEFIDVACLDALKKAGRLNEEHPYSHDQTRAMLLIEADGDPPRWQRTPAKFAGCARPVTP